MDLRKIGEQNLVKETQERKEKTATSMIYEIREKEARIKELNRGFKLLEETKTIDEIREVRAKLNIMN